MHPFPSWWMRWWSYVMEIEVETIDSTHQPPLTVCYSKARYQLYTEDAIYSYDDLYDNFYVAFKHLDLDQLPSAEVLVLGFGLGSIPYMLEHCFEQHFHYTGVEFDEAVIYLASKYTLPRLRSSVELIQSRAEIYAMQARQQFAMICIDVFINDKVPEALEQAAFLERLKALLLPKGIILFNRLSLSPSDREETEAYYKQVFSTVFDSATYIEVKGNWILVHQNAHKA